MSQNHPSELLPALALGCLDGEEVEPVLQHLSGCDHCRAEMRVLTDVSVALISAAPQVGPPASLKSRLIGEVRHKGSPSWFEKLIMQWPRMIPATAAAAIFLVAVLGFANVIMLKQLKSSPDDGVGQFQVVRLHGTANMPAAEATLIAGPESREGVLVVNALEPLPLASQYQLWLIKDGRRSSGGTFSVSPEGSARIVITSSEALASFDAFGITVEPYGGSSGPTGPESARWQGVVMTEA